MCILKGQRILISYQYNRQETLFSTFDCLCVFPQVLILVVEVLEHEISVSILLRILFYQVESVDDMKESLDHFFLNSVSSIYFLKFFKILELDLLLFYIRISKDW